MKNTNTIKKVGAGAPFETNGKIKKVSLTSKHNILGKLEMNLILTTELNVFEAIEVDVLLPLNNISKLPLYEGFAYILATITDNPTTEMLASRLKDIANFKGESNENLEFIEYLDDLLSGKDVRVGLLCVYDILTKLPLYTIGYVWPEDDYCCRDENYDDEVKKYQQPLELCYEEKSFDGY